MQVSDEYEGKRILAYIKNHFLKKAAVVLFSSSALIAPSAVSADGTYYFMDDISNKQDLYTVPNCRGEESDCIGFGTPCGIGLFTSRYSMGQAQDLWRYKGRINIRSAASHDIVCQLTRE